jgi:succinyl-diaminopimelate desuccinylase
LPTRLTPELIGKALSKIGADGQRLARLTADLVRFKSENPPLEDNSIQAYIRDRLEEVGAKVEMHDPGGRALALTSSYGDGEEGLILYGHADVVPAGDASRWKYPPYEGRIEGDRIYGRGASDMKAGLAAMVYVYTLLHELEVELPGRVTLVSVLDEENWHRTPLGWNTSDWLLSTGRIRGKACVMGEPTGLDHIVVGERGDYWVRLKCRARPMHGSFPVFDENACIRLFRAIEAIARMLKREKVALPDEVRPLLKDSYRLLATLARKMGDRAMFKEASRILESYSINVGVVRGGTMINNVPEACEAEIAFCVPLGSSTRELHDKILALLSEEYGGIELELMGESQSDPTYTSPRAEAVRAMAEAAREATGKVPRLVLTQATSDGNIYRKHGIETCSFGPGDFENIHGYDESVSISATVNAAKAYFLLIPKYFGAKA